MASEVRPSPLRHRIVSRRSEAQASALIIQDVLAKQWYGKRKRKRERKRKERRKKEGEKKEGGINYGKEVNQMTHVLQR